MKIIIITVGKKNSAELDLLIKSYQKRINYFSEISWMLVKPSSLPKNLAKEVESKEIKKIIPGKCLVWLLDERGSQLNNDQLLNKVNTEMQKKDNTLVLIIGGPYGVNDTIRQRADFIWSISKLVFPHQLVRLFLIEQLYRTSEISKNSGYHHS